MYAFKSRQGGLDNFVTTALLASMKQAGAGVTKLSDNFVTTVTTAFACLIEASSAVVTKLSNRFCLKSFKARCVGQIRDDSTCLLPSSKQCCRHEIVQSIWLAFRVSMKQAVLS